MSCGYPPTPVHKPDPDFVKQKLAQQPWEAFLWVSSWYTTDGRCNKI